MKGLAVVLRAAYLPSCLRLFAPARILCLLYLQVFAQFQIHLPLVA
jgi:hypothetical protein